MKLVASMIVRNELGRYLPLAVAHLLSYCDEIRVLDDNSDDGTFEWLRKQKRVDVIRNPGPAFYEYESQARQILYEHVLAGDPDYVLAIDADEFVAEPALIRTACKRGLPVYTLSLVEVWHADVDKLDVRVDGLWKARTVPILYRPKPGWKIRNKQLACGREPVEVVQQFRNAQPTQTQVLHFGWTRKSERIARAARYDVHDGGRFHNDRHLQSILWEEQGNRRLRLQPMRWPSGLQDIATELAEQTIR